MKKAMAVIGVILIIAGILSLLMGALWRFAFYNTMDASSDHYEKLLRNEIIAFAAGAVLTVLGIVLRVLRKRI